MQFGEDFGVSFRWQERMQVTATGTQFSEKGFAKFSSAIFKGF